MIETGNAHPRRANANKLADALRVPREEFWSVVRVSKEDATGRMVDDGRALVQVGIYLPYRVKRWYQSRANDRGMTFSRMMADVLRAHYLEQTGNQP